MSIPRVTHLEVSGTFSLDGETFDVTNNVWVFGDAEECIVIDAPHSVDALARAIDNRRVLAIVCTHAHDDHVRVAPELAERFEAPILLHPDDAPLWQLTHPGVDWDGNLTDGETLQVAGLPVHVLHTPGHSPGGVCLHVPDFNVLFSGDTLFRGGPGATGRSYSDRDLLVRSIREKLFALPDRTIVHTGHGPDTTIGREAEALGR